MSKNTAKCPVVFLDRDGTLNQEVGYIRDIAHLKLISGAGSAVRRLNLAGIAAVVVTNQSGAARGYYAEKHIKNLNKRLLMLLEEEGAYINALYYCPHLPDGIVKRLSHRCNCRKPEPGMILTAYAEHPHYDHKRAYVIGDKNTDIELAYKCQVIGITAKAILVATGYGKEVLSSNYQAKHQPHYIASHVGDAVAWLLKDLNLEG